MTRQWIAAAGLLVAACGGTTTPPTPPTPAAPQITCPADVSVKGITGSSQPVTYSAPTTTAGAPPVNVSCSQVSGSSFSLGTSTVNCTATDAQSRQAVCSFKVTVSGLTLAVKKFEAFGDSLTEGENGAGAKPNFVDPPNSYPTKLLALLEGSFPGQGLTILNRGESGKTVAQTRDKIVASLPTDRPEAVLLLTGYNNLTGPCATGQFAGPGCGDATQAVSDGVRECIQKIKASPVGVRYILVSTLTPPGTGRLAIDKDAILEANVKIRKVVAAEGVTLVDTHPTFLGHEAQYVSIDGLHLNPAGYQAIADAFLAAIKSTIPQTSSLASVSGLR
jgi:lysophospholipase L1-like esterase